MTLRFRKIGASVARVCIRMGVQVTRSFGCSADCREARRRRHWSVLSDPLLQPTAHHELREVDKRRSSR